MRGKVSPRESHGVIAISVCDGKWGLIAIYEVRLDAVLKELNN